MSNDRNKRGDQDRIRVARGQDWEISYMTKKYNCSEEEVQIRFSEFLSF